ncbi:hypothetical protein AB1L42_10015 [Thalassoglobus sp. JC818]|uniref:hypothetical protein n=1 Tax=Thalassoglobus sp. JC818 TaxID=3232136 RepID=UPI00345A53DB
MRSQRKLIAAIYSVLMFAVLFITPGCQNQSPELENKTQLTPNPSAPAPSTPGTSESIFELAQQAEHQVQQQASSQLPETNDSPVLEDDGSTTGFLLEIPHASVRLPVKPTQNGPLFECTHQGIAYTVVIGFLPKIEGQTAEQALEEFERKAISADKQRTSSQSIQIENASAAKYVVYEDGEDVFIAKLASIDNFLVQLIAVTPKEQADSAALTRYFESLRIHP